MHPGPPGAALRLWLGYVCLALVQAGKGARLGARRGPGGRAGAGVDSSPVPAKGALRSLPCSLGAPTLPRSLLSQSPAASSLPA